jgi:hypothetical protein
MVTKLKPEHAAARLDVLLLDLARIEGELANLRLHPASLAAARVVEGVRRCLHVRRESANVGAVSKQLDACATRLVRVAGGPDADGAHPKHTEYGRQAEQLRATVDRYLEKTRGGRDPAAIAAIVDVVTRNSPGPLRRLLGGDRRDRIARWTAAIAEALVNPDRTQHAEQIVLACARASGMRRPADLFGRESRATIRRGGDKT